MLVLWPVHQLEAEHSQYPGIMTLSAVLKERGYRSEVVPTDEDVILKRLAAEENAVLGFSTPSALSSTYVGLNRRIKRHRPDVFSVFGGAHPTYFPDLVEEEGIDGICMGEGEYAMLDLVSALDRGTSPRNLENWWIKEDGFIHRNPMRPLIENLDELPLPDRAAFAEAISSPNLHAIVMTGRGCPYGCTYCYNHLYRKLYAGKGKLIRRRSVEHVIRELRLLKDQGYRFIRFMDDLFTLQPEWVHEFSQRYPREIGLPFTCLVRANSVDEAVVADLKHAGCHRIMMGIEAGNERLRNEVLKRRMSDHEILEAGRIIRASGIRLVTANILALPGGTLENDWETVDLNIRVRPSYSSAAILHAFPGTEIHETAESMGLFEGRPRGRGVRRWVRIHIRLEDDQPDGKAPDREPPQVFCSCGLVPVAQTCGPPPDQAAAQPSLRDDLHGLCQHRLQLHQHSSLHRRTHSHKEDQRTALAETPPVSETRPGRHPMTTRRRTAGESIQLASDALSVWFRHNLVQPLRSKPMAPRAMHFISTHRCNARCVMCGIWKETGTEKEELSPEALDRILADGLFAKMEYVGISGGEPFLREDLTELCRVVLYDASRSQAHQPDHQRPAHPAHGRRPARDRRPRPLAAGALLDVSVSVARHGRRLWTRSTASSAPSERIERTIELLKGLRDDGRLSFSMNCVLLADNLEQAHELRSWAAGNGIPLSFVIGEHRLEVPQPRDSTKPS